MTSSVQCIITGCDFLDVEMKRWCHGDLHMLFDIMLFNAGEKAEWYDCINTPMDPDARIVKCEHFYERNGQIVFPLAMSEFNRAANVYLNNMMDEKQIITFGRRA